MEEIVETGSRRVDCESSVLCGVWLRGDRS